MLEAITILAAVVGGFTMGWMIQRERYERKLRAISAKVSKDGVFKMILEETRTGYLN